MMLSCLCRVRSDVRAKCKLRLPPIPTKSTINPDIINFLSGFSARSMCLLSGAAASRPHSGRLRRGAVTLGADIRYWRIESSAEERASTETNVSRSERPLPHFSCAQPRWSSATSLEHREPRRVRLLWDGRPRFPPVVQLAQDRGLIHRSMSSG